MSESSKELERKIEALLFASGDPLSLSRISKICDASTTEVKDSLISLKKSLEDRGISLIYTEREASLATNPKYEEEIRALHEDEVSKPLGKAGIETLAIILYQGPVTKSQIDYIRGVNSASILRNLMIRGLVERKEGAKRSFLYSSSIDTLRYLGISSVKDLPEYEKTKEQLENGVQVAES